MRSVKKLILKVETNGKHGFVFNPTLENLRYKSTKERLNVFVYETVETVHRS